MKYITILLLFFFSYQLNAQQPNILWIVCEDISPTLSFYGDSTAKTPKLDQLATESLIYNNAFANVGVCAPSRSAIITGKYPTSIGTMHMRAGKDITSWGKRKYKTVLEIKDIAEKPIREYSVVLPEQVKCFSEYLRGAGYFCTNNDKTDYQFAAPVTAWDQNSKKAHWRNRREGKPFFSVFNFNVTHESKLWKNADLPLTVSPDAVPVPPYFADNETTRQDIARHYSNIELLDAQVGKLLEELEEDGLYDNTIIFFYSDHGGPLPRQKREIYDSGLKVPFMVRMPKGEDAGRTDHLISFVDLAPTVLSLAGIAPPDHMDGQAFLGIHQAAPRNYVFGSSDRFDDFTDRSRMVRNQKYLYVRNYYPEKTKYKDVKYRKNIPSMNSLLEMKDKGNLNDIQMQWFASKDKEELFDCESDPHQLHNLAEDREHQQVLTTLRRQLLQQSSQLPDWGQIPESEMIDLMWPEGKQPKTATPEIQIKGNQVNLTCETAGASIAYLFSDYSNEAHSLDSDWQLYSEPFAWEEGKHLSVMAERIGFEESEVGRWPGK